MIRRVVAAAILLAAAPACGRATGVDRVSRPTQVSHLSSASPSKDPLSSAFARHVEKHRGRITAAVYDEAGRRLWTLDPRLRAYTASIVKVPILLAAIRAADHHRLSAHQRGVAARMIEQSDNDAATQLWRDGGEGTGLRRVFAAVGMTQTHSAPTLFEPWDGHKTSARDQVRLLRRLVTGVSGVPRSGRNYVLHLMRHVEPSQRWGASAGTTSTWSVALKNGWVPVGQHGWTVDTIGLVTHKKHRYAIAVLCTGQTSEAAGITWVDEVARHVANVLR